MSNGTTPERGHSLATRFTRDPFVTRASVVGPGRRAPSLWLQLFLLLVVFALGPLFLSNIWGYAQSRGHMVDAAFRDVRNVAAIEAAQAEGSIDHKRRLLSAMAAANEPLAALLAQAMACDSPDGCASVRNDLSSQLVVKADNDASILELLALTRDGTVLATSEPVFRGGRGTASLCLRSAAERRLRAELQYSSREPILLIATPVADALGNEVGLICGRFAFDVHAFLVTASREQTVDAVSYLVDDQGEVLCSSVPRNEGVDTGHPIESRASLPALGSQPWHGRYRLGHGRGEVLASYAPVPSLPWGVLVEVPIEAALSDLERLKWQAAAFGGALALLFMVVASITARRMARPLTLLAGAARRMSEGELGQLVSPTGPKEVFECAAAFNRMSIALSQSQAELETRIEERTEELQKSREFLELLINSIEQRVVVVDSAGFIVKANRKALALHGGTLVGRAHEEVFGASDSKTGPLPVRKAFDTGRPATAEATQTIGADREIMRLEAFPVLSETGEVEAVVEIGRVVTAEKRIEAQMIHQEKMATIGLLAAGMAHDIGNPLASIMAQLKMTREIGDKARVEETLNVVDREIGRISRLLGNLVRFARKRRDETTRIDVNSVIGDVQRLLAHDPRARRTEIRADLTSDLPAIWAQEDRIVQVLLNLGINALDAMPDGGSLTFETRRVDGAVVVRVRDTGPGVSPEIAGQLFEPFATTKPEGRGTGLGLLVSRGIVQELGGSLRLDSSGPEGAVFTVALPYRESEVN